MSFNKELWSVFSLKFEGTVYSVQFHKQFQHTVQPYTGKLKNCTLDISSEAPKYVHRLSLIDIWTN